MRFKLLVICSLIFSLNGYADGFPIDKDGNILAPYLSIKLEAHQKNGLRMNGMVLLTDEQLAIINKPGFPQKLQVLSPHHSGCTCGLIYGIWFTPDSLAIEEDLLEEDFTSEVRRDMMTDDEDEPDSGFNNGIFLTLDGGLLYRGAPITTAEILNIPAIRKNRAVLLFVPPRKGNVTWYKVVQTLNTIDDLLPGGYDTWYL